MGRFTYILGISFVFMAAAPAFGDGCKGFGFKETAPSPISYDQSNIWKVSGPDGRSGLVLGIIHTTEGRVVNQYSKLTALAEAADLYYSEVNFEPSAVEKLVTAGNGPNSLGQLPEDVRQKLSEIAGRRRTSLDALSTKADWYLWSDLSRPLEIGYGIDHILWGQRKASGKAIVPLEEMDHLIAALTGFKDSETVLKDIVCDYPTLEAQFTRLKQLFISQDFPAFHRESLRLESHTVDVASRFHDELLVARNLHMIKTLKETHKSGESFFLTVGLAHLPGENGLLDLLTKSGYKVSPLTIEQASQLADPLRQEAFNTKAQAITDLMAWIKGNNSTYSIDLNFRPQLKWVTTEEMIRIACNGQPCDLKVYYSNRTIYVHDSQYMAWLAGNTEVLGRVAAGLLHFYQEINLGGEALCSQWQDLDMEAYLLQNQYLMSHQTTIARRGFSPPPERCR